MENPIEMDDLGVPLFLETPILKHGFVHKFVHFILWRTIWTVVSFLKVDAHQKCPKGTDENRNAISIS